MSPITLAAKERLEAHVMERLAQARCGVNLQISYEQLQAEVRRLENDLIAAVRGEHPEDQPF